MAATRSPPGPSRAAQDRILGRLLGGRYRVMSRLGEGGMGAVYLCAHAVLGRRYAVKVLRPELAADPELVERFRNEAIAASRIGGENVVDVLDFGEEEDGARYYVMEALEGRSLGAVIVQEGPLEIPRALVLLEQICRALGAAHARGVVHRDVKPANVFVVRRDDGTEHAKVIDFGISRVTLDGAPGERLTHAGAIIGTPEYMAPEQGAGEPVDQRADVYALGVVAYEMLTGTLPFTANTPVATLLAHQTRTPDAPSQRRAGIPPEVDALVLAALAKRPEDRPPSMQALAARLAAVAGSPAATARAATPAVAPAPPQPAPRAETLSLPGSRAHPGRARLRGGAIVLGAAVLAAAAVLGARALRPRAAAAPSVATAPLSPPAAAQVARPSAPAAEPRPPPPPAKAQPAPAPARTTRRPSRSSHLEDPYDRAAGLKPDPF